MKCSSVWVPVFSSCCSEERSVVQVPHAEISHLLPAEEASERRPRTFTTQTGLTLVKTASAEAKARVDEREAELVSKEPVKSHQLFHKVWFKMSRCAAGTDVVEKRPHEATQQMSVSTF